MEQTIGDISVILMVSSFLFCNLYFIAHVFICQHFSFETLYTFYEGSIQYQIYEDESLC